MLNCRPSFTAPNISSCATLLPSPTYPSFSPARPPRRPPRGVGDRLAAVELDVVSPEEERAAAQLEHAHLERHACARGGLLEDHRERLAGERGCVAVGGRLDRGGPL